MKDIAELIRRHIDFWSVKASAKAFRPKFVYHFTELKNAASVINSGVLFSRSGALELGLMKNENAAVGIIGATQEAYKHCVRLYYRPRTPTQFHNEGIKPLGDRYQGAHCPVPIFLAFDKLKILTTSGVLLSDGNVAAPSAHVGDVEEMFKSIDFAEVFHHGSYDRDSHPSIKFHRQAEILVPNQISLSEHLAWIGCRTSAERQTLLHLLSKGALAKYMHLVRLADSVFFEKSWIFVDKIEYDGMILVFYFNANSKHIDPIEVHLNIKFSDGSEWTHEASINLHSTWTIKLGRRYDFIDVRLTVLGCLAYENRLSSAELL